MNQNVSSGFLIKPWPVLLDHYNVVAQDLGGLEPRRIIFNPVSGKVWLKRVPYTEVHQLQLQEDKYASKLGRESHRFHDDDVELFG